MANDGDGDGDGASLSLERQILTRSWVASGARGRKFENCRARQFLFCRSLRSDLRVSALQHKIARVIDAQTTV
jgi:hypothetical protein